MPASVQTIGVSNRSPTPPADLAQLAQAARDDQLELQLIRRVGQSNTDARFNLERPRIADDAEDLMRLIGGTFEMADETVVGILLDADAPLRWRVVDEPR